GPSGRRSFRTTSRLTPAARLDSPPPANRGCHARPARGTKSPSGSDRAQGGRRDANRSGVGGRGRNRGGPDRVREREAVARGVRGRPARLRGPHGRDSEGVRPEGGGAGQPVPGGR